MDNLKAIIQMFFAKGKSSQSNMKQGRSQPVQFLTSPGQDVQSLNLPHIDVTGRPVFAPDDQLNLFRHLAGIISHPSLAYAQAGARAAPNLGIYARVVHNEQISKIGFKYFSWLINGCLGLQIVVAAALTAMGAAGASRSAVTVFGAINTVIAGVLTFLKGSGLPNRFKYYQTEWKRVREFIEQRERDFSRPDCDLDLYGVVAMVENMYEEVKIDLEASTPDRFAGFSSAKNNMQHLEAPTGLIGRVKDLESGFSSRVKDLASDIGHKADMAKATVKEFQERKDHLTEDVSRGVKESTSRLEVSFGDKMKGFVEDIGQKAHETQDAARELEARKRREVESLEREAGDHARSVQGDVGGKLRDVQDAVGEVQSRQHKDFEELSKEARIDADTVERTVEGKVATPLKTNVSVSVSETPTTGDKSPKDMKEGH